MKSWLSDLPVQHKNLRLISSEWENTSGFYMTAKKQDKCLLVLHFYKATGLALVTRKECGVSALQLAEDKKRSICYMNIQFDEEASFSQIRYQWLSFTWWKSAKFLLRGVRPRPKGCDGSHTKQVGCVWLQVSQSDIGLKKVLHCVTCLLSLQKSNRVK